jgi:hypothetical protein
MTNKPLTEHELAVIIEHERLHTELHLDFVISQALLDETTYVLAYQCLTRRKVLQSGKANQEHIALLQKELAAMMTELLALNANRKENV